MTIAISIPVHEEPLVVINQIQNIKKYVPNAVIVIHISIEFTVCGELKKFIASEKNVFLNPQRLSCCWGNIIDAHISNFEYIKQVADFDYFMFHASNDMYILPGVENYISQYDVGFHVHKIIKKTRWWPSACALEDSVLEEIVKLSGAECIVATQIESSFYKKEIFEKIVQVIQKSRKKVHEKGLPEYQKNYTREEVYFSTIAYKLLQDSNDMKRGYPTTYSEVHDFDRILWRKQYFTWGVYHRLKLGKIIPKSEYDKFERNYTERFTQKNPTALTVNKIKKLIKNQSSFLNKHKVLNDSVTRYTLYGSKVFSVKRVPRKINDPLRVFINSL